MLLSTYLSETGMSRDTPVNDDSRLTDDHLGLDSLHLIELAFYCSEALGLEAVPEQPPLFETVADVGLYLEALQTEMASKSD